MRNDRGVISDVLYTHSITLICENPRQLVLRKADENIDPDTLYMNQRLNCK